MQTDAIKNKLYEGCKVKLCTEKIIGRKNWNVLTDNYKKFVKENADSVFTVLCEEKYVRSDGQPVLVSLAEDTTTPRWLFWEGDLKRIEENCVDESKN